MAIIAAFDLFMGTPRYPAKIRNPEERAFPNAMERFRPVTGVVQPSTMLEGLGIAVADVTGF